jgi:hypothetical protein
VNPDALKRDERFDERVPECYGHCGYGEGYAYPGRCSRQACRAADSCYIDLRDRVERDDPEHAAEYERRRQALREEGLDSNEIVSILASRGFSPTTQAAYLWNVRRGQLASGRWHECADTSCDTLILTSYGPLCGRHKPEETRDGTRDGGQDAGAPAGHPTDQP